MSATAAVHKLLRRVGFDIVRWPRPHDVVGALGAVLKTQRVNCVFDVGANVGDFGRQLRDLGYAGRIVSFEPSQAALPVLRNVARRDAEWIVRPVAVGAEAGSAQLYEYEGSNFNSLHRALPGAKMRFPAMVERDVATVAVTTLADERSTAFADIEEPRVLLKCDTQGHDLDVLAGDPGLPDVVAVLIELSAQPIYADQPYMTRVIDALRAQGFLPVVFQPVTRAADRLTAIEFDGLFVRARE